LGRWVGSFLSMENPSGGESWVAKMIPHSRITGFNHFRKAGVI
jgi:hypothetical protein